MNKSNWITAICSGGSFLYETALKVFETSVFKKQVQQVNNNMAINEILLYGAENEENMQQIGLNNLFCIYYVIIHARKSIDMCVPSLVSETLAKWLINVQQKNNIKIKITIHSSDDFHNLQLFAQNGIEVKIIKPSVRLEHEFLLVDASYELCDGAVAVIGSLDYDTNRVNCNRDATMLTSEVIVVTSLKREFDRIWNSVPDETYAKNDKLK